MRRVAFVRPRAMFAATATTLWGLGPAAAADWVPFSPLPTAGAARAWACGVRHPDGRIFAVAGSPWVGGAQDGSVEYLPPGGSDWITAAALDGPKISQAAGVDSLGRIIVYGGKDPANGDTHRSRPYDPVEGYTGNISERPEAWPPAYFAWARDDQGRLYAFGGNDGEGGANSAHADRYDATLDAWQNLRPMNSAVSDAAAVFDGQGHILVIGGLNAGRTARTGNVARYDLAADTWSDTALPDLPVPTSGHRVVLGSDNRVYVLGGEIGAVSSGTTTPSVWALNLNEASPTWTAGPSMATPRKHFGAVLDTANTRILVMGGENNAGGTNLCETLLTPTCPDITSQSTAVTAWRGSAARFWASASGAAPFTYQWRRDGAVLSDGPTGTGSQVSGATTGSLSLLNPDEDDIAAYEVTISNACGSAISAAMTLAIRTPPTASTNWQVINLHPSWIQSSSYATGIDQGRIVGYGSTPTTLPDGRVFTLAQPLLWSTPDSPAQNITPPGSVGGALYDIRGNVMTGWFWHTWSCWGGGQYWTCAWQSAGSWDATTLSFTERHESGAEYDSLYGTDGYQMVATVTHEYSEGNYTSTANLYDTDGHWIWLHPTGYAHSYASAVDGGKQYGSVYENFVGHRAAMWSGSAASFVNVHPAGYQSSGISGARDGQAVGSASIGGVGHAGLWTGAGGFVDLHPGSNQPSGASATHQGVQVGLVNSHAALWLGTPESVIDLGVFAPAGFGASSAYDVEVAPDLTITIVGAGYNTATGRYESLVWRSLPSCPADFNRDGFLSGDDFDGYVAAFEAGDNTADFNADGFVTGDDFDAFVAAFEIGC